MIYPSADKLEGWGSKYSLVVLAAKRAKQLKSGAAPLIDTDSRNPLTVALEEIAAGAIECRVPDNDLLPTASEEPEVAALLGLPTEGLEEEAEVSSASLADEAAAVLGDEEDLEEELEAEDEELDEPDLILGDEEDEAEEEEESLVGFQEDDETRDLLADDEEAAPEEESIDVPKKPGRKRKAKAEPEVEPVGFDDVEDVDVDDMDDDSDE